jgi:hypothetical protein
LEEVGGPIFHIPKDAKIVNVKPKEIREFFSLPHYSEHEIQLWTETAIEYRFNYLSRSKFEQTTGLACSDFKRPLLAEASEVVRKTVQEFRVASSKGKIIGAALQPENLMQATRLLRRIRGRCYEEVLDDRLSVPELPMWGKTNNPQQWWNLNDYEILLATFQ